MPKVYVGLRFAVFFTENSLTMQGNFEYLTAHFRRMVGWCVSGAAVQNGMGAGSVDWKGGGQCER